MFYIMSQTPFLPVEKCWNPVASTSGYSSALHPVQFIAVLLKKNTATHGILSAERSACYCVECLARENCVRYLTNIVRILRVSTIFYAFYLRVCHFYWEYNQQIRYPHIIHGSSKRKVISLAGISVHPQPNYVKLYQNTLPLCDLNIADHVWILFARIKYADT